MCVFPALIFVQNIMLVRVMLEGKDKQQIDELLNRLVEQLEERLSDNEDCKRMAGI